MKKILFVLTVLILAIVLCSALTGCANETADDKQNNNLSNQQKPETQTSGVSNQQKTETNTSSVSNEIEKPSCNGDHPLLTLQSEDAYTAFLNTTQLPADFVSYADIRTIGNFKAFVVLTDAYANDYSQYMYTVVDSENVLITLHVDHRDRNEMSATAGLVSKMNNANMRCLSDAVSGHYLSDDGITYRYISGKLHAVSWDVRNVHYTLCVEHLFADYPLTESTFVGKMLNLDTSYQTMNTVFDKAGKNDNSNQTANSDAPFSSVTGGDPSDEWMVIQSPAQLNELRAVIACDDAERWTQALQSTAVTKRENSKEELIAFVTLVDSLPQISILDKEFSKIMYGKGISEDTGKEYKVIYVITHADNGDWTRVEYILSITDVSRAIAEEKSVIGDNSLLSAAVSSADGKMTLYAETREPHPTESGTMIRWWGETQGIFTRIVYYTNHADEVNSENIASNMQISAFSAQTSQSSQ